MNLVASLAAGLPNAAVLNVHLFTKGSTVMKQAQRFALVAILVSSFAAVSPSHAQMGGMDMKDMDMEKCKGMDMSKCKEMMGKDKKGMEMQGMGADKKSEAKSHKGA